MKMMKKAMSFLIAAGFLITLATPVSAESQTGSDQWQVAFDGQKMKANYTAADFADSFSDLQPGDTVSIEITLKNVCGEKADWYIQNNILDIFEEADAADGAYTYQLTCTGTGGFSCDPGAVRQPLSRRGKHGRRRGLKSDQSDAGQRLSVSGYAGGWRTGQGNVNLGTGWGNAVKRLSAQISGFVAVLRGRDCRDGRNGQ